MHLPCNFIDMCSLKPVAIFILLVSLDKLPLTSIKVFENAEATPKVRKDPGIFQNFLKGYAFLVTKGLPGNRLSAYCRTLQRHIEELDYSYTQDLAYILKRLCRKHRDDILEKFEDWNDRLEEEGDPRKEELLEALDEVFTPLQSSQFADYLHDLEDFGRETKRDMEDETRKLIHDVIHANILKRGPKNVLKLESQLKRALKEYRYGTAKVRVGGVIPLSYRPQQEQRGLLFEDSIE